MEKIYLGKLDIEYFKKCVTGSVEDAKEEYGYNITGLIDALNIIKFQCYGIRDVFWLFTADDIYKIVEPVDQALSELELYS